MSQEHRKCVLIVDDSPENVSVIMNVLKDTYRTKVATNGFRAILLAESEDPPDLILLDVLMPDMVAMKYAAACGRIRRQTQFR